MKSPDKREARRRAPAASCALGLSLPSRVGWVHGPSVRGDQGEGRTGGPGCEQERWLRGQPPPSGASHTPRRRCAFEKPPQVYWGDRTAPGRGDPGQAAPQPPAGPAAHLGAPRPPSAPGGAPGVRGRAPGAFRLRAGRGAERGAGGGSGSGCRRRGPARDVSPGEDGAMSRLPPSAAALLLALLAECTEAKKHCWYFEGLYPTYYICRPYEDCCGSRCCVRALSIQRLWYFWFLLMMGVLFCCGAGFFIRRRMYPPPLIEEPAFNVSYSRQPPNPAPGAQPPGLPYYTDPGGPGMNPAMNPMAMAFQVQPNSPQGSVPYPPPPSYCNTPPPPYEQVVKAK